MHSKQKGIIGELAVSKHLAKLDLPVFKEFGDLSKVDLITIVNNKAIKLQVKALKLNSDGAIHIKASKSGPNYRFVYAKEQVDIFCVYEPETDTCLFIAANELLEQSQMSIRFNKTKNNQRKNTRYFTAYTDFFVALRKI